MKKIVIIISSLLFFTSCKKKVETFDKPEEFVANAKNTDLSILFNTVIQARNESEGAFHYTYVQVFDISGKDTFNLPSFEFYNEIVKPNNSYDINEVYDFAKQRGVDRKLSLDYSKKFTKQIDDLYYSTLPKIKEAQNHCNFVLRTRKNDDNDPPKRN